MKKIFPLQHDFLKINRRKIGKKKFLKILFMFYVLTVFYEKFHLNEIIKFSKIKWKMSKMKRMRN